MRNELEYTKRLEQVGFTRQQSEAQVEIMSTVIDVKLVTKQEMKDLRTELRQEMKDLGVELRHEMKELGIELRQEMKELGTELRQEMKELRIEIQNLEVRMVHLIEKSESKQTLKLGAMMSVIVSIALALAKLIH